MTKTPSFTAIAALVCVCALGYGLGTGWIRLGDPEPRSKPKRPGVHTAYDAEIEEEFPAAVPPDIRRSTVPRRIDPAVQQTQAVAPTLVASAVVGSTPQDVVPSTFDFSNSKNEKIFKAIQTKVDSETTALVKDLFAAETDLTKVIDDRAQLTENYAASRDEIRKAATDAATDTAAGVIRKGMVDAAITAVNDFNASINVETDRWPSQKAVDAGFTAANQAPAAEVKSDAKRAANSAAIEAIEKKAKERITLRTKFGPKEITLSYSKGASIPDIPLDSSAQIELVSDGPTLTFKAKIAIVKKSRDNGPKFDDKGSNLTLELVSTTRGTKPYLPIPAAEAYAADEKPVDMSVVAVESGPYDLVVTLKPMDGRSPVIAKYPIVIRPTTQNIRPVITNVDETQDGARFHFEMQGSAPIQIRTGNLILTTRINAINHQLIIVNADSDEAFQGRDGLVPPPVMGTKDGVEIKVSIPPDDITDKPMRLAVVDLWTREMSDAITVMITGGTGSLPIDSVGIRGTTGKNPVFQEYTPPRQIPDGFKPSDHVETRVARLYYYRDAHRVAQIVNRQVKSHNRVAVDTRRRMAEKARDEADTATDSRRLEEIRAVRGAQATRLGEAKLRQAQNDLDNALRAEQQARTDLPVLDTQLQSTEALITQQDEQLQTIQDQLSQAKALDQTKPENATGVRRLMVALSTAQVRKNQLVAARSQMNQQKTAAQATIDGKKSDDLRLAVTRARTELETLRTSEAQLSDERVRGEQVEDRSRENQFRQEVAAAHEDPDTYAAGDPLSADPVLQVSISVIGEGLIQLRGPIKGINVIRTMINQIDAPTSQVRVGIHTVQINGEHGDRIEQVATRIQDYIDHSRFLTSQSTQLLRNAVVKVASDRAHQAVEMCPNAANHRPNEICPDDTQLARDARYQEAFFGSDFINELRAIDSEFLMTGNKLLSLHSMDTTSLASALFLLALAKNDIRQEILAEFQRAMQEDLPTAESNYYDAGAVGRPKPRHHDKDEFKLFAGNAKFQSFLGFFNAQVAGSDTLNPLQREFLKLAQIFKSRLVTEMEYNQRVKERGLIEDRIDPIVDRKKAREDEATARETLLKAFNEILSQRDDVITKLTASQQGIRAAEQQIANAVAEASEGTFAPLWPEGRASRGWDAIQRSVRDRIDTFTETEARLSKNKQGQARNAEEDKVVPLTIEGMRRIYILASDSSKSLRSAADNEPERQADLEALSRTFNSLAKAAKSSIDLLFNFMFDDDDYRNISKAQIAVNRLLDLKTTPSAKDIEDLVSSAKVVQGIAAIVRRNILEVERLNDELMLALGASKPNGRLLFASWMKIKNKVNASLRSGQDFRKLSDEYSNKLDSGFGAVFSATLRYESAQRVAELSRRPLDHKRLLDMLIDDVEDKYIELLEGTRAHTANIDAYIKNIATALDDDFNTQFYYPAFTEVRQASRFHDVTLAKIETTNVLANNRGFGKVEPQATMEFDLPKRDILINEAMNGALAMTKDFGALVNDPTFLSMAKLRSGQPTSSLTPGAGEGVNTVRNTLPGLSRADDEKLFSQQGAGRTQFGSAMEALIPDPAVYKFETGTGFEIRPVVQPDGQSVVFHFNYMYTTNIREPVRADEKHLGRVKRHFIDTDVQLGNYELREISRYQVALKAARTSRGIPLFEDIPGIGILFRPLPSAESSLQENIVLGQSTIFPTLFDLMGLRWAPAVADLDTLRLRNDNFVVRGRNRDIQNHVFDISSGQVDEFLQTPPAERRPDLYRSQETIRDVHPNGYRGPGLNYRDSRLQEGYDPVQLNPESGFIPSESRLAPPSGPSEGADLPALPPGLPPTIMPGTVPVSSALPATTPPPALGSASPFSNPSSSRAIPGPKPNVPMIAVRPNESGRTPPRATSPAASRSMRQAPSATTGARPTMTTPGMPQPRQRTPAISGPSAAAPSRIDPRTNLSALRSTPGKGKVDNAVSQAGYTRSTAQKPKASTGKTDQPKSGRILSRILGTSK